VVGEHAKHGFDVRAEVADGVSSVFPEGQNVVGVAVEAASSWDFVVDSVEVVDSVMEAAVVEGVEGMYSLGIGSKSGVDVPEVVQEAADTEVMVGSKVAVNGVTWAELSVLGKEGNA
jgi:hypothetical protein